MVKLPHPWRRDRRFEWVRPRVSTRFNQPEAGGGAKGCADDGFARNAQDFCHYAWRSATRGSCPAPAVASRRIGVAVTRAPRRAENSFVGWPSPRTRSDLVVRTARASDTAWLNSIARPRSGCRKRRAISSARQSGPTTSAVGVYRETLPSALTCGAVPPASAPGRCGSPPCREGGGRRPVFVACGGGRRMDSPDPKA